MTVHTRREPAKLKAMGWSLEQILDDMRAEFRAGAVSYSLTRNEVLKVIKALTDDEGVQR